MSSIRDMLGGQEAFEALLKDNFHFEPEFDFIDLASDRLFSIFEENIDSVKTNYQNRWYNMANRLYSRIDKLENIFKH